jgi:hypothetical protein
MLRSNGYSIRNCNVLVMLHHTTCIPPNILFCVCALHHHTVWVLLTFEDANRLSESVILAILYNFLANASMLIERRDC